LITILGGNRFGWAQLASNSWPVISRGVHGRHLCVFMMETVHRRDNERLKVLEKNVGTASNSPSGISLAWPGRLLGGNKGGTAWRIAD